MPSGVCLALDSFAAKGFYIIKQSWQYTHGENLREDGNVGL